MFVYFLQKMKTHIDFLRLLAVDVVLKILMCLHDPADVIRASAVSQYWQKFGEYHKFFSKFDAFVNELPFVYSLYNEYFMLLDEFPFFLLSSTVIQDYKTELNNLKKYTCCLWSKTYYPCLII